MKSQVFFPSIIIVVTSTYLVCQGYIHPSLFIRVRKIQATHGLLHQRVSRSQRPLLYSNKNDIDDLFKENRSHQQQQNRDSRKATRNEENIPGKTSAIPGAKDYEINVPQTEQKWYEQADDLERRVRELTTQGMNALKLLKIDEAASAFENVYQLNPNAYCWHYGIVLFYLGKYQKAAYMFTHNANQCEIKFQIPASEERIWYYACYLKQQQQQGKRQRRTFILDPTLEENNHNSIYETRKVIRLARELFQASVQKDWSLVALIRAQLHSVATSGNTSPTKVGNTVLGTNTMDRKMWKLTAWYYLGLHYDSLGYAEESKKCIKMALRQCATSGNGVDSTYILFCLRKRNLYFYHSLIIAKFRCCLFVCVFYTRLVMHILPMLHMTVRDWYDDEDFFEEDILLEDNKMPVSQKIIIPFNNEKTTTTTIHNNNHRTQNSIRSDIDNHTPTEMAMIQSMTESIEKLKLVELQASLRKRNMKTSGSKSIVRARLLEALLREAGLSP